MMQPLLQQELLAAAVSSLPQDALSVVRNAGVAHLAKNGFPTTKHEDWKYTNLAEAAAISNDWLQDFEPTSRARLTQAHADARAITEQIDAHWITVSNGQLDPEAIADLASLTEQGVTFSKLGDDDVAELISIEDAMSAFNAALLQGGFVLAAAGGAALEKPIGILFIDDGAVPVTPVRVLIEVAANASLGVVECQLSTGSEKQFSNSVVQAAIRDGGQLDYVRIQQRSEDHLSVNRVESTLDENAVLTYCSFDFGGALARTDVVGSILGAGASVNLHGLYLASGQQHIDNHTRVDHMVGPGTSKEEYRGILAGRSRCVFNGKAVVHKGADGTDADQSNHNLLLSEKAEVDTKPELEIYADDVKCSHGATVGQLDKAALFYLRARGLDQEQAAQALTRAFGAMILSALPIEACRDYVSAALDRKLDALIGE